MGKKSMHPFGYRLRQIADEVFDGNQSELARSLDMKPSSFAKYTGGNRKPGSRVLQRLSRLGVDINWFLSGDGSMMQEDDSSGPEEETPVASVEPDVATRKTTMTVSGERFYHIPVVRVRESEDGPELVEDRNGPHWLAESYIRRTYGVAPARLREFQVTGNAMENTIRSGDWVLVGMWDQDCLVDGAVCLIRGPSGMLVRRIGLNGLTVVLTADNASVPDLEISRDQWRQEYEPLGSILAVMRRM